MTRKVRFRIIYEKEISAYTTPTILSVKSQSHPLVESDESRYVHPHPQVCSRFYRERKESAKYQSKIHWNTRASLSSTSVIGGSEHEVDEAV